VAVLAVSLVVAGCGAKKAAAPPPATSTSTAASTTTTATTVPPVLPLTGLAPPNAADLNRVALVVKVDNVDQARPQAGLEAADVVFEEQVEGQLSRLIAVFQSTDSTHVGPVRSTRTTDIDIVSALNRPLYAYSGGNANFVRQLDAAPIVDVGAAVYGVPYYTHSGPFAVPHDLYANTVALYGLAKPGSGPPPPLFAFRAAGSAAAGAGAAAASHVDVSFGMMGAAWDWSAASQTWQRSQDGTPDVLQDGARIGAANVIVQMTPYTTDGYATGEGVNPPPPIPKGETVGTGTALVFTGGMVIHATWTKAAPTAVTQYTDASGQPISLAPGHTWVELVPVGNAVNVR
jgi:hypothetical protein